MSAPPGHPSSNRTQLATSSLQTCYDISLHINCASRGSTKEKSIMPLLAIYDVASTTSIISVPLAPVCSPSSLDNLSLELQYLFHS